LKLTDAQVAKATLPAGKDELMVWDTEVTGFGLRVRKKTKTYIVMYRPAGAGRSENPKRYKIGTTSIIETAAEARRLARAVLGKVAEGKDPAAERTELKRRAKARVESLLLDYDNFNEERGYVDRAGTLSTLQRNLKHLFNRDIATISGSEYVAIRKRLTDEGLKGAADTFWSRCRAFLSWCVNDQILQINPIISHKATKRTRKVKIADEEDEAGVVIPGDNLMDVWEACDMSTSFGRYMRFLILTGCRRTEASKAARAMRQIDKKRRPLLILPKYITKSGRDHNLPLTKQMVELLKGCEVDARSDLYFPSRVTERPMQGWANMLTKLKDKSGVEFALHDLRKTFRTGLAALGVDNDIAGICLNHSRRGLEAVYNKHEA
jgi:integrase